MAGLGRNQKRNREKTEFQLVNLLVIIVVKSSGEYILVTVDKKFEKRQKPVFVFKNHRTSFYYWCKARKRFGISDSFFVVTMDHHNDLFPLLPEKITEIQALDLNNLVKVENFAKNKLKKLNDDYIFAAMEAGLIGDILIMSAELPDIKEYTDSTSVKHKIFHCLWPGDLSGPRGLLTDSITKRNRELITSIGYDKNGNPDIVLDIDLDFFTYYYCDNTYVIDEENFKDIFSDESLIWWIYDKARLITIAKEPWGCGGPQNSKRILRLLKKYFLERQPVRY